jgi:hypothetical protein
MLRTATWLIDFLGLALALWLAAFLISRGFRSAVTRWAGLILILIASAFLIGLYDLEAPDASHAGWWALVQTFALLAWYSLTYQLLTPAMRRRIRWMAYIVYGFGLIKIVVLAVASTQSRIVSASDFNINPYNPGPFGLADVVFLLTAGAGTLVNFRLGSRTGYGPHFQALWVASILGALAIGYGTAAVIVGPSLPRAGQDALLVAAIALCGYAIARYQAFVERRTTLRDLPISGLAVFGLAALYGWLGWREGFSPFQVALVVSLAIVSHAAYDRVRDFLERVLHRHESLFRRQLRTLARDAGGDADLPAHLAAGHETLVRLLGATGGFVAVKREAGVVVMASIASLPVGTVIAADEIAINDVSPPGPILAERVTWLAPAFAGEEQVAVIGLARRFNRGPYSEADLDLLVDMADWAGRLVAGEVRQRARRADLLSLASAVQSGEAELQAQAQNLLTTLEAQPDRNFARLVEHALQHLADYTALGQSALVDALRLPGANHIERGKAMRQRLLDAIDSLRPSGARPHGVPPREWQAYAILHDAYVEDTPNREIMSRLYIGEGTFNRQRRKALQAIARALLETAHAPSAPADPAANQAAPG